VLLEQRDRRVVPRWRDFGTTLALGELDNSKPREPISREDQDAVSRRAEELQTNPNIWYAADLLSSAFVVGDTNGVESAAKFILANRNLAPGALVSFANRVSNAAQPTGRFATLDESDLSKSIHEIRARLREEPYNAIQWVELSRFYSLLGDSRRAMRSMTAAVSIAPDNRFVVRSAARLFLHEQDADTALKIIRRASGAKRDPWLLAAEIAVASASRSPSLFAKIGAHRNADENVSLFARTELSSALATLDMESGKTRKARQLFRQSLECPNENSVAQVEWANRQIGGLEIDRDLLETPRSFEARANLSLAEGKWDYAVEHGTKWLLDQPFSKRPAIFTSYVSSLVEDYQRSIDILKGSLHANPDDPSLINNLAFALGSANRLDEAASVLRRIDLSETSDTSAITLAATHGLLLFRGGLADRGRELYELAIRRANKQGIVKYRVMADLYLAREELIAATSLADATTTRALAEASKLEDKDVALIASQVRELSKPRVARSPAG
jgi:tetratricopeptide (TPR) repeat protein